MPFALATAALLTGAIALALWRLRTPGWANRSAHLHALVTLALGVELAGALALWQIEAASGLSSGVPLLVLVGSGALALATLTRGTTPAAVASTRRWRAASVVLVLGAAAAWWQHLESLVPLGRSALERELIANTTTLAAFGVLGLGLIALVPVLTATRAHALRRIGVPVAAAAMLALPLTIAPAAVSLDATCGQHVEREGAWCREVNATLRIVEDYKLNDGAWEPVGGPLMSATQRLLSRERISAKTRSVVFAERDHSGVRLDDWMRVDGYIGPTEATALLAYQLPDVDACFVAGEERGVVRPGVFDVGVRIDAAGWDARIVAFDDGDDVLRACLQDALVSEQIWSRATGPTTLEFAFRYLGHQQEVASRG